MYIVFVQNSRSSYMEIMSMETAENDNLLDSFRYMYFYHKTQLAPEIKLMNYLHQLIYFLPLTLILKHNTVEPVCSYAADRFKDSNTVG